MKVHRITCLYRNDNNVCVKHWDGALSACHSIHLYELPINQKPSMQPIWLHIDLCTPGV